MNIIAMYFQGHIGSLDERVIGVIPWGGPSPGSSKCLKRPQRGRFKEDIRRTQKDNLVSFTLLSRAFN